MAKTIENKFFIFSEGDNYTRKVFKDGSWIQYRGKRKNGRHGRSDTLRRWWKEQNSQKSV
jgi:hypothetical protein